MDRYRVFRMVHGRTLHGEPVSSLIDPQPIGVFGNYVIFRWGFRRDEVGTAEREKFAEEYLKWSRRTTAR